MSLKSIIEAVQDSIESIVTTPTDPEETPVQVFNNVLIGMPEKIPRTDNIVIIEHAQLPNFYYTTCKMAAKDADIYISIFTKGHSGQSHLANYEYTDLILTELETDPKFSGNCINSTIEDTLFGDALIPSTDNLMAASRIILRCKL